jgi:hypothetical protein
MARAPLLLLLSLHLLLHLTPPISFLLIPFFLLYGLADGSGNKSYNYYYSDGASIWMAAVSPARCLSFHISSP